MALIEYRKVLDLEPTVPTAESNQAAQTSSSSSSNHHDARIYDLRPEAAYNMSLI